MDIGLFAHAEHLGLQLKHRCFNCFYTIDNHEHANHACSDRMISRVAFGTKTANINIKNGKAL